VGEHVVIDAVMTPDVVADELSYTPQAGDFDTEGVYRAWIFVNFGTSTQTTDEFQINVFAHAPGQGTGSAPSGVPVARWSLSPGTPCATIPTTATLSCSG
jgi:hypothetical protein